MTERETHAQYVQDEVVYFSIDGRHQVLSTILKEIDMLPKIPTDSKQTITTVDFEWFSVNGHSVCVLPENASDDTVMRALTRPAYDEDFVGPHQPLMRGEIGEMHGIRVVTSPWVLPVKAKPRKRPPQSKGPAKHRRRW